MENHAEHMPDATPPPLPQEVADQKPTRSFWQWLKELPDHGTKYFKMFWGAYKGHVRSLMRGLLIGAIAGLAVGIGMAALWGAIVPLAGTLGASAIMFEGITATSLLAAATPTALIATFTGIGAIFGAELMGKIGNNAGTAAAYFAETEMRQRYPSLPEISKNSPAPGFGHHFEVPPDDDKKLFHTRVAIPGLLVGTAIGGLLALGTGGAGAELLGGLGMDLFSHLGAHVGGHVVAEGAAHAVSATTQAAIIGAGGLMGASFGINRGKFKSIFNYTDSLLMGNLAGPTRDQKARDRARYKEENPEQPYVISGAQRYDEYQRLLTGYYNKAAVAGWQGDRRGYFGGLIAGALSGLLAAGLVAAGLIAFMGVAAAAPYMAVILPLCTALGAKQGMNIFADAGREPASWAVADEIHKERLEALKSGKDITFDEAEKRASNRLTHHPDMDPPGLENRTWYNWKIGVAGLAGGALAGLVLAPIAVPFIAHIFAIHATITTIAWVTPITVTMFGLAGATFGMGDKTMDKLYNVADNMFMGTLFPGHSVHDHKSGHDYPAVAPDSPLIKKKEMAMAAPAPIVVEKTVPVQMQQTHTPVEPKADPPYLRNILATKPEEKSFVVRNDSPPAGTQMALGGA